MARQKKTVEHITSYSLSFSTTGRIDRPVQEDEYEKFADHFMGDYGEEIDVTYFVKEVAC